MYLFYLILSVYLILGSTIPLTNAGLLDSLGGVIGLGVNANTAENRLQNNNNNYVPNFIPNPSNYNLNNNNNNGRNINMPNNNYNTNRNVANGNINSNRMRLVDPSKEDSNGTVRKGIFNLNPLELTEKEKIAVQKFPELQNLLDRLKEMNKQKELEKQNNLNKSTTVPPSTPKTSEDNTGTDKPVDQGAVKVRNGWKMLKKRKFFFKAQPVRPENEIVAEDETVYFLD